MLLTEQSHTNPPTSETTLTNKKQQKKLSARWELVDGKLVCRWVTK